MYGGNTPPSGWAFCDGSSIPVNNNPALYSLLGSTFGGDDVSFNLPDMRGRFFVSADNNQYSLGQTGGAEQVSLLDVNLPVHGHSLNGAPSGGKDTPKGLTWGTASQNIYGAGASAPLAKAMSTLGIKPAGQGKPHDNMIPFQCVNYIIALDGIYPSPGGNGGPGDQYLSEIRIFPYTFVPGGWLACNGQALPVRNNEALYSLLQNTYGGSGSTFNIPDLVGRVATHVGNNFYLGQQGGEPGHVLSVSEMPAHNHDAQASSSSPDTGSPIEACWATNTGVTPYGGPATVPMASQAIMAAGGNVPHENRSPFLVLNICMANQGIYPTQG